MTIRSVIAVLGVLALAGCENMGLEYAGPEEEAQLRPPYGLVASVMAPVEAVGGIELVIDGQLWVPSRLPLALDDADIRPIGSANGHTVYARSWDEAPYDQLFTRIEESAPTEPSALGRVEGEGWRAYAPVIGGGGRARHSAAGGATGAGHDAGAAAGH